MKVEKTEFIGYVQLYMKFWVPEYPDCAFYATFDTDFSKPLTQCILEELLQKTGECIEKVNGGIILTGSYISKEQYQKECEKHNSEFNTSKCKFDKTEEKVQISDNQKN